MVYLVAIEHFVTKAYYLWMFLRCSDQNFGL
uniref:Uncharacterized protein n=1 Tax=Arundo donax TaxID=35708 RepID=A0A0A8Y084_ARUDO